MVKVKNVFKHFHLVNKHRWYVFKLSIKAGVPFRGFVHDLSKYSYDEFVISAKYYDGHKSPIHVMRSELGYSTVWLHHKGHNKHHFEYWEDLNKNERIGVFIPYKYIVESICDKLAAGMAYKGKDWNCKEPLIYWKNNERDNIVVKHPGSVEFIDVVLKKIYDEGVNKGLNKNFLKKTYNEIKNKYKIEGKYK
ncbi:MAG: catalase [Bacilli bacterium]|nr:catalase [Bacilli bacterium]